MKKIWLVFTVLAVLLSDIMCGVVAYAYCDLGWGGKYAGYSAPPSTAFMYAVPYSAGIIVCVVLAVLFYKRAKHLSSPPQSF